MMERTVNDIKGTEMENGLRILARMIAQAHLRDMSGKQPEVMGAKGKGKENDNGDKRYIRDSETSQVGEDKAGDKERGR
jgi:hypothetical protein